MTERKLSNGSEGSVLLKEKLAMAANNVLDAKRAKSLDLQSDRIQTLIDLVANNADAVEVLRSLQKN